MIIKKLLTWATNRLATSSDSPELDAELILAKILKISRAQLLTRESDNLNAWQRWRFYHLIKQRARGCPVAYLIGYQEFYGHQFKVNKHVLIPRPESELLIEHAIRMIRANHYLRTVADVGTGSGSLAITLALELPHLKIIGCDISAAALKVAYQNAHLYNVTDRINLKHSDLLNLSKNEKIDLIIANLPYVTQKEYEQNPSLKFEPKIALLEQPDLFKKFCQQAASHLETRLIIIETSPLLINKWVNIAQTNWTNKLISTAVDLSQRPRFIIIDNQNQIT